MAPTFHVSSHVYLGAKKLSILPVFLGFFLGTNMLNRLVAATAGSGLFKLAATLIGAGFGMARSKSTVVVAAGAAPAAPTNAELVFAFRS